MKFLERAVMSAVAFCVSIFGISVLAGFVGDGLDSRSESARSAPLEWLYFVVGAFTVYVAFYFILYFVTRSINAIAAVFFGVFNAFYFTIFFHCYWNNYDRIYVDLSNYLGGVVFDFLLFAIVFVIPAFAAIVLNRAITFVANKA